MFLHLPPNFNTNQVTFIQQSFDWSNVENWLYESFHHNCTQKSTETDYLYYQNRQVSWISTEIGPPLFSTAPNFCDFRFFLSKSLCFKIIWNQNLLKQYSTTCYEENWTVNRMASSNFLLELNLDAFCDLRSGGQQWTLCIHF